MLSSRSLYLGTTQMSDHFVRYYRRLTDEQLLRIALHEASGLIPEALAAMNAEIAARGLPPAVSEAVDAQLHPLSGREKEELTENVRKLPCPYCDRNDQPLKAAVIASARGMLFVSILNKHIIIACPDCLRAKAKDALNSSLLLGWWCFPWGPFHTMQAIVENNYTIRLCNSDESGLKDSMLDLVERDPGGMIAFVGASPRSRKVIFPFSMN